MILLLSILLVPLIFIWPRLPLWLFIVNAIAFVIVFLTDRHAIGPVTIPVFLEMLMAISAIVWVHRTRTTIVLPNSEVVILLFLVAWSTAGVGFRHDFTTRDLSLYVTNFIVPFALYFAYLIFVDDVKGIRTTYFSLLVAGCIIISTAALNLAGFIEFKYGGAFGERARMTSTLANPNQTASTLLYFTCISIAFTRNTYRSVRYLSIAFAVTAFSLVPFTLSRGALLPVSAMLLYSLLAPQFSRQKNQRNKYIPLGVFAVVFTILFYLFSPQEYWARAVYQDPREEFRYKAILSGIDMFLESPIYGVGFGRFAEELPSHNVAGLESFGPSHNGYIQVLSELGLIGMLLWGTFVWSSWKRTRILVATNNGGLLGCSWPMIGHSMRLVMINYLLYNMTNHTAFSVEFILVAAMLVRLSSLCKNNRARG